jgi:oxygen-independent coproporphyrinogen-3 oxidase
MQFGIYVHIPFCRQKCYYCDFASYAGQEKQMAAYAEAVVQEMHGWDGAPATIYIGGGTPTALPAALLGKIIGGLKAVFDFSRLREFTVEVNPGTVDAAYLAELLSLGVDRLSFGVQSFNDSLLKRIGRIHTAQQAQAAIKAAQAAGFRNISLDLMYGLPGQTLSDLADSIAIAAALSVQHISIYGLQLEKGTVFERQAQLGKLRLPDDVANEKMYDYMVAGLPQAGYERYEISNFAQPGFASRHNLGYWQDVPYLGFGAAAHSYWQDRRRENDASLTGYITKIQAVGDASREEEPLTRQSLMEEFAFLALRTVRGIEAAAFQKKFHVALHDVYDGAIRDMQGKGLLAEEDGFVHLTPYGMKYGNVVFEAFLL